MEWLSARNAVSVSWAQVYYTDDWKCCANIWCQWLSRIL